MFEGEALILWLGNCPLVQRRLNSFTVQLTGFGSQIDHLLVHFEGKTACGSTGSPERMMHAMLLIYISGKL